jgi:fluoride ion exporter CrcB/FEX
MAPWLRYLIAFVVFAHGFVYVRIGSVLPGPIKAWRGRSWLLSDTVTGDQLRRVVVSLHVAAGIALLACAVAIALAPSLPGWWRPLAITGAAIGLVAFSVFWDGQTRLLFEEGVIGAVVSLVLLIGAIALASGRL